MLLAPRDANLLAGSRGEPHREEDEGAWPPNPKPRTRTQSRSGCTRSGPRANTRGSATPSRSWANFSARPPTSAPAIGSSTLPPAPATPPPPPGGPARDPPRPRTPRALRGALLCEAVALRSGDGVLDVATGSGNTAISAARRFCEVTGMDLAPESIEHARRRAEAEGMEIAFEVGDAEDLPYADASFDVVLSTIGVMFCPYQEKAAGELLRVCRPGGKIGLASWTPDGFTGKMLKTVGRHVPPPPGIKPPSLWGTEERLEELLGGGVSFLETTCRTYSFRYPSPDRKRVVS